MDEARALPPNTSTWKSQHFHKGISGDAIEKLDEMSDPDKVREFINLGDEFIGGEREYEAVKRSIGG